MDAQRLLIYTKSQCTLDVQIAMGLLKKVFIVLLLVTKDRYTQ
jgi:hypothetical protein